MKQISALKWGISLLFAILWLNGHGQIENYNQINIQGQLPAVGEGTSVNLEFLILDTDEDTLWQEVHEGLELETEGLFSLGMGAGTYLSGSVTDFNAINWMSVSQVELYRTDGDRVLYGRFGVQAVAYAMHSLYVEEGLALVDLSDWTGDELEVGNLLKYDGVGYVPADQVGGDTTLYAFHVDSVLYADTVWFALNNSNADSAFYAAATDTVNFTQEINQVVYTDSAIWADSTHSVGSSVGNWSIFGNSGDRDSIVGSLVTEDFVWRTNNTQRLVFGTDHAVHNNHPGIGLRWENTRGALFQPATEPGFSGAPGAFMYFDGETRSFHGGLRDNAIDTLKGLYSFAWGQNVGTNGDYSTVFGKNTFGDTSYFGGAGTPYASISSFAAGRNCRVGRMSVAIGDSAIANYYRNVAIGKNVVTGTNAAGTAIGNNVFVSGATGWGAGNNITVDGHFSTAIGSNAHTDGKTGSFIYGDLSTDDTLYSTALNQFMARTAGGVIFYSSTDLTMGVELAPGGGSWSMVSDRNKKQNINALNPLDYRFSFEKIPVFSWTYINEKTTHIGPMAQDFKAVFGVGEKPTSINMLDADGVTLLGIKNVHQQLKALPDETVVEETEKELNTEKEAWNEMELRINALYEKLDH